MARSRCLIFIAALIFSSMSCYALETSNPNLSLNIAKIQQLTGQVGQLDQDQKIYKITIPRDDLKILLSGMQMTADRGLSSWVTFKKANNQTVVNGDLILLQDQINPVMSVALTNGLQVTGLHNPYLWDSPRVMFMHIKGEGDELQLASAIGQVLKKIKTTSNGGGDFPLGNFDFLRTTLDAHKIDVILGQTGQFKDDVYKIEFGDGLKATDTEMNKIIALNTWAAFAGSDSEAVVNGTLVLHESELQKILVKLRNAQIYVLAIYQNTMNENRDLVFVNFWGIGNTQTLAKALRSVFFIAQNNNSTNITVGEISPDISPANVETKVGMAPIQLSLYKNNNCNYVKEKELYTSIDVIHNATLDDTKQLSTALRVALYLTQKIISGKMTELARLLPATAQTIRDRERNTQILPSAKNILSKLSVVSNNAPAFLKLLASKSTAMPVESDEEIAISNSMQMLSAVLPITQNAASKKVASSIKVSSEKLSILENERSRLVPQPFISVWSTPLVDGVKSLANTVAVDLSNISMRFHAYIMELTTSYIQHIKLHVNSISAVATSLHVQINKFVTLCANLFKSFAHIVSAAFLYVGANVNEFAASSVSLFQSLAQAASVAVVRDINALSALSDNVSQSFDYAAFTAISHMNTYINEFSILSISMLRSCSHIISAAAVHMYTSVDEFAISSIGILQSFSHAIFAEIVHMYTSLDEFAIVSVSTFQSSFHVISATVASVYIGVNGFAIVSARGFQSLAQAASVAVVRDFNVLSTLSVNVSQLFDYAVFSTVTQVNTQINELTISSVNMLKSFAHLISVAAAHVYEDVNEFAISSISISQSLTHAASVAVVQDINTFAVLAVNMSQLFDYAAFTTVARVNTQIDKLTVLSVNRFKLFSHAVSTMAMQVHMSINKVAILSMTLSKTIAHATFFILSETAGIAHSYTTSSIISLTQSFSWLKNIMIQLAHSSANQSLILLAEMKKTAPTVADATVQNKMNSLLQSFREAPQSSKELLSDITEIRSRTPSMLRSLAKAFSPTSPLLALSASTSISASAEQAPPPPSHDQMIKSLSAILPVAQPKVIAASSRKIAPASLPIPQHKVIRVATVSKLPSVIPVTHHKVKAVPTAQHNHIKMAKLSLPSLPYVQPIKNHNASTITSISKPSTSLAHAKTIKHEKQLNKKSLVALRTTHNKYLRYASNKITIHPVVHPINHKPRTLAKIVHVIPHEKNWNTEQLAPAPRSSVRVAQRHRHRMQQEFDDGPVVMGAYPYDEEPTPGGFGG